MISRRLGSETAAGKLKVILFVSQYTCHLACHVSDLFRVPNDSMMMERESKKKLKRKSFPLIWTKALATTFYLTPNAQILCVSSCFGFVKIPQKLLSLSISL